MPPLFKRGRVLPRRDQMFVRTALVDRRGGKEKSKREERPTTYNGGRKQSYWGSLHHVFTGELGRKEYLFSTR